MLKRVPGVSFSSDMLEYDQVQLRGLPPIYAQVQVNGQNMTGAGNDRVFFMDRIPAEVIDSIEVIRSPSADHANDICSTVRSRPFAPSSEQWQTTHFGLSIGFQVLRSVPVTASLAASTAPAK